MSTTLEEFHRWLAAPREGENLEFKEAKNQYDLAKLFRYCVALANEGGGKLVLGVTDQPPRRVVGSQAFLNPQKICSQILEKLRFRVDAEELPHPEGRVIVFHIPPRPAGTAYQFEGAYLMRSGDDTLPMTEDRLRQIFDEGRPDCLLQPAREHCSADDVVRLLDTQSYFDLLKLPYPPDRSGVLDRFEKEKLILRGEDVLTITNLGAVLFAKRLEDFEGLFRKAPRVIVYEETGKLKTKMDKPGTKGYAVGFEGVIDFVNSLIPRNEVIEKALRQEVKMFPEIAVRELIANALIHQDFTESGTSVVIELYADRLEVSSPGKPFIPPERFIDEYQSRNERLADLMRRFGVCEEKAESASRIIRDTLAAKLIRLEDPNVRSHRYRSYLPFWV